MTKTIPCPICKKAVPVDSADVPFCSDRCRLIDLGKWASGDYKIISPILDPDVLEDVERMQREMELQTDDERHKWKN